jgi:predicted DNA-binding transcriptional regulator YafY
MPTHPDDRRLRGPWKNRHRSLVRCLRLVRFLNGRRWMPRIEVMASEIGVSTRTVSRYLDALEEAHYELPPRAEKP